MKIKVISMFLIAVLLCSAIGCATSPVGKAVNPTEKTAENTGKADETVAQSAAADTEENPGKQSTGLLGASSSITATTASGGMYLHIAGHTQGTIRGECTEGGDKKNTVALVDFSDGATVPIDNDSGLPSGHRKYEAVTFVHKLDCSSPKLHQALSSGEQLDLIVDFYRIKNDGSEEKYYSIIYENAIIVSMEIFTKERSTHFEEVSFTFSKVTYMFHDGNITFRDTWK